MYYSFHPDALKEYLDAVCYYADVSPRLGRAFVKAIEAGIDDILRHPQAWQCVEDDIRRHLIKRFPFGIYYCTEGNEIFIYAIMHMSRHPDYWKSR